MITRMLALVGLGLLLGAADSWIRPVQLRLIPQGPASAPAPAVSTPQAPAAANTSSPTTPPTTSPAAIPAELGLEITVPQAKALFDSGVMFVDARPDDEYSVDRVQGALHLTTAMFSGEHAPEALAILDPAAPVVIYCSGGDCDASHSVGIRLQQAGYAKIHIMVDGLPGWKEAGHPIDASPVTPGQK